MSMADSTEIGWIITNKDSDEYANADSLFDACDNAEDGQVDYFVPGTENHPDATSPEFLSIETHPHTDKMVFVTWCCPDHGFPLDGVVEPRGLSVLVRDYIKKLDPEAVVTFGVIVTRR